MLFTEKSLWRACLKGNNKAFERLYRLYYPLLYNYGRKFSPDEELVRDCIQNLFVKLIQNYWSLSDTPSIKGYLLKAFRNHLYDALRMQTAYNEMFLPCIEDILSFETGENAIGMEEELQDNIPAIREAFRELSSRQQEILYLYYVVEAKHNDIATALNINYQSSKNLLARSLARLKELFFQKMDAPEKDINVKSTLIFELREYQSRAALY